MLDAQLSRWLAHDRLRDELRDELRELLPVLRARAERLPFTQPLSEDIPLVLHGRYLDAELSAAFSAITQKEGKFRNFYTGVEKVCDGRYDLLLVTLEKSDATHEHLRYRDFPLSERTFHWQSQAATRQSGPTGRRHVTPERTSRRCSSCASARKTTDA